MITIRESELNKAYKVVNTKAKKYLKPPTTMNIQIEREYTKEEKIALRRGEIEENTTLEFKFDKQLGLNGHWILMTEVEVIEEELNGITN